MKKNMNKLIWWIYSHLLISTILFYFIAFILMMILISRLGIGYYDFREILRAILDTNIIKKLPLPISILITFLIPLIFPIWIRSVVESYLFPTNKSQVISTLYDRCWEICRLGQIWVRDSIQKVIDKIDGFRTGIQVKPLEVSEIVNALYEITDTKIIRTTWLLDINALTDDQRHYLYITHQKVQNLNKFSLTRYFIADDMELFTQNHHPNVIWFVKQHNKSRVNLKFISRNNFIQVCNIHGVDLAKCDILFFDERLILLLIIDETSLQPQLINGNYILEITDTPTDKEKYSNFFKDVDSNSTDLLNHIRENQNLTKVYRFDT